MMMMMNFFENDQELFNSRLFIAYDVTFMLLKITSEMLYKVQHFNVFGIIDLKEK